MDTNQRLDTTPATPEAGASDEAKALMFQIDSLISAESMGDVTSTESSNKILSLIQAALSARDACPLGLEARHNLCSAGTCPTCVADLRAKLAESERRLAAGKSHLECADAFVRNVAQGHISGQAGTGGDNLP